MTSKQEKATNFGFMAFCAAIVVAVQVLAFITVYGADVSDAFLTGKVTGTETSGDAQTNLVLGAPIGSQGLIDSGTINASTSNMVLCQSGTTCPTANELVFEPSRTKTRIAGAHQDDGGTTTDDTIDANDAGASDVALIPTVQVTNDAFYFLADHQYRILHMNIGTAGVFNLSADPFIWEYYNGTAYVALSNVSDGTNFFTNAGTNTVSWDIPDDMARTTFNGTDGFPVRARATFGDTWGTQALATQIWYEPGILWFYENAIAANQAQDYTLFAGGPTRMATSHRMFFGETGATTSDSVSIEFPANTDASFSISGYMLPTQNGNFRYLMSKNTTDHHIRWSSTSTGVIQAQWDPAGAAPECNMQTTGVTEGLHTIRMEFEDDVACRLYVDDTLVSTATLGSVTGLRDNANGWTFGADQSLLYANYANVSITGVDGALWALGTSSDAMASDAITLYDSQGSTRDNAFRSFPLFPTTTSSVIAPFITTDVPADVEAGAETGDVVAVNAANAAFASSSAPVTGLPGGVFIAGIATDTNLPQAFFWLIISAFMTLVTFIGTYLAMRNLLWAVLAGGVVLTAFAAPTVGVTAVWVLMFYGIMSGLVLIVGDRIQASSA